MATVSVNANTSAERLQSDRNGGFGHLRVVDFAIGVPLCIVAIPVVFVLAVILAVIHRGNPFFVHERIGWRGRRLMIPKLRTLPPSHDPYADKTAVAIVPCSRLAAFLRSTHLDELPQLFLVPVGRMSLVGPRPRMVAEAAVCSDEEYGELRTSVLPGCTGLWQISEARGRVSDHPEYDRLYLERRTVRLDVWIMWRTAVQFLGARPIGLDEVPGWSMRDPASLDAAA